MKAFYSILSSNSQLCYVIRPHRILFLILLTLISCSNKPQTDVRVSEQQSFAKVAKEARDQADNAALTDPNRPVMIDDAVKKLKAYIVDTLNSKFTDWDVRVLDNTKTDPNGSEIRITFGTSIDGFDLEETARYKSIVFREWLSDAQSPLREKMQSLNVGDHVKITGSFVTRDKKIDIDPYNEKEFRKSKNIFSNPEFRVDITDLNIVEE
ncbi:MAG: hypothetical protein WBJ10_04470 [Daejeonella sp.]|uniref:hypothetical protein n=1 Tax=Daejeonella sp. TaxID=2805397 RepID=UPI003C76C039